jgi:hypothetical protein
MAVHLEALRPSNNPSEETIRKAGSAIAAINKKVADERRRRNRARNQI